MTAAARRVDSYLSCTYPPRWDSSERGALAIRTGKLSNFFSLPPPFWADVLRRRNPPRITNIIVNNMSLNLSIYSFIVFRFYFLFFCCLFFC